MPFLHTIFIQLLIKLVILYIYIYIYIYPRKLNIIETWRWTLLTWAIKQYSNTFQWAKNTKYRSNHCPGTTQTLGLHVKSCSIHGLSTHKCILGKRYSTPLEAFSLTSFHQQKVLSLPLSRKAAAVNWRTAITTQITVSECTECISLRTTLLAGWAADILTHFLSWYWFI